MTVAAQTPSISYNGNGTTTVFAAPFRYIAPTDLRVVLRAANGTETVLTYGTGFTAAPGNTNAGGNVTLATAPASGTTVIITRRTARTQPADYITAGAFTAESHEEALDRAQLVNQEQDVDTARAVKAPVGEAGPVLKALSTLRGKLLAMAADGLSIEGVDLAALTAALVVTTATSGSVFASRDLIAAVANPVNGQSALLTEDGLYGMWKFNSGNLSTQVTADPDRGLTIAPASASTGASGAWVRVVEGTDYFADWWLNGDRTLVQDALNRALKLMPAGATLRLPPASMTVARAAAGSVTPGSSTFNGGIVGAIYLDKDGQQLIGCGKKVTVFDGLGAAMNVIVVRASGCKVMELGTQNAAGNVNTSESSGVSFQPKLAGGAHINDCTVTHCWFDRLDTGVGATSEADLTSTPRQMWVASGLKVSFCEATNIRRQGYELFNCDNSSVYKCSFTGADRGEFTFSRFVRVIGSRNVRIHCNTARGFDATATNYLGISVETSGFYGLQEFYRISADVQMFSNRIDDFGVALEMIDSQESVLFFDNQVHGPQQSTASNVGVRITSAGIRNPGYGSQTLTGSITRTDNHGLTTGTPIWSMQNFNGLVFGTTYYAIVLDANRFRWATSEANALAGTAITFTDTQQMVWLRESEVLGLPNKNGIEQLSIKSNRFRGLGKMVAAQGRVVLLDIEGNNWIANRNNQASGIDLTMIGTHPFENIEEGKVKDNRLLGNNISNVAPISVAGMKSTSVIAVDENRFSASASGATITHNGPGVLNTKDAYSNTVIPVATWAQNFDPPPSNIFAGA